MSDLKISILTIVRNPDYSWFQECLRSVANQTYRNIEHIVLDGSDGPFSDNVLSIVDKYPGTVYKKQLSKGLWPAFSEGLEYCTGDVIGVINSDDYLADADTIDFVVKFFPEYDYIYGKSRRVDENNGSLYVQAPMFWLNNYLYDHLVFNISHHTLYFKRDILNSIPFVDDSYGVQAYDLIFCRKLFRSSFLGKDIRRILACFRLHSSNHSRTYSSSDTKLLYAKFNGSERAYFLWRLVQYVANPQYFYYLVKRTLKEILK